MAKLFEEYEEPVLEKEINVTMANIVAVFLFLLTLSIIFLGIVMVGKEKREINKNDSMELVKLLENDNGNIITQKVKYETSVKVDPEDTSGIFFEVVNGNEKYFEGDLIKFNHRFVQEQQFEGKKYCIIDASQIQCVLRKKHVKKDLLKR